MKKKFYFAWIEEEEKWCYSMKKFDLRDFPYGYVDYEVEVNEGVITSDTYSQDRIGKPFEDYYDKSLWLEDN